MEGGGVTDYLRKVLSRGDTVGVVVWVGDLGVFSANIAEARGSSCGVTDICDKVKVKKAEVRFVTEGGGGKSTSWIGDTTAPDLLGQEAGESGGMGGLADYL